jgi:ribonuclease P protein component
VNPKPLRPPLSPSSGLKKLTTKHRLHYRREYLRFFDQSEAFKFRECVVYRIKNDLGHPRLGITLKAKGTSIQRNRTKRVVREAFRNFIPSLQSYDYNVVIPASKKMDHLYAGVLAKTLVKCFEKISVQE